MKNKLIWILVFLFFINLTYAYDYNTSVNESIAFIDFYNFTLSSSTDNNTVFFNFYSHINMSDNDITTNLTLFNQTNNSIYFNQSNTTIYILILINISDTGSENITYYIKINSTNSNITINKTIFIEILPFIMEEPFWYDLDVGEFQLFMCSYRLPVYFEKKITIAGIAGQFVDITKSTAWFNISRNITIGLNNYTTIMVNGIIPEHTEVKGYIEYIYFNFTDNNIKDNVTFIFEIEDCGLIIKWSEYISICNQYDRDSLDYQYCFMDAQTKYNEDWLYMYQQINKSRIVNITQNVTVEVPVEVFRIENTSIISIISAAEVIVENQEKLDNIAKNLTVLFRENLLLRSENQQLRNVILELPVLINATSIQLLDMIINQKSRGRFWFWFFVWIIIIGLIGYGCYRLWKENQII